MESDFIGDGFVRLLQGLPLDERERQMRKLLHAVCDLCGTKLDENEDCPACLAQSAEPPRPRHPLPPDVFQLVPLASLPESTWKGRPVFHPCEQRGDELEGCLWVADDLAGTRVGEEAYDVGVVERWAPDPDFADLGVVRVWFIGPFGSRLHYASSNLWTPAEVVAPAKPVDTFEFEVILLSAEGQRHILDEVQDELNTGEHGKIEDPLTRRDWNGKPRRFEVIPHDVNPAFFLTFKTSSLEEAKFFRELAIRRYSDIYDSKKARRAE
jgi:hypothetical protein